MRNSRRKNLRVRLFMHQAGCCFYCQKKMILPDPSQKPGGATATLDHIHPKSKGGSDVARNYVLACRTCNSAKANSTEWSPKAGYIDQVRSWERIMDRKARTP